MGLKYNILRLDRKINQPLVVATNNRPTFFNIYWKSIMPLRVLLFKAMGGMKSYTIGNVTVQNRIDECIQKLKNRKEVESRLSDILRTYVFYGIDPLEYFLFNFKDKKHDERRQFLSDRERMYGCVQQMTWNTFSDLKEKDVFYGLAKSFFKRDVCVIKGKDSFDSFCEFVKKQPRFFAKPITGTFGMGAGIYNISDYESVEKTFNEFVSNGDWMAEEVILQDNEMAKWNPSSVNTIRVPSFISKDGTHAVINPTIRTGRQGFVIDNASAGGVTASIDVKTGIIISDGIDKGFNVCPVHPDSKIKFKGSQIPQWKELMETVEAVHRSLPRKHKYIGFDFALSATRGWILIEGNWGQLIGSQTSTQVGIRYQFEKMLDLPADTSF